MCKGANVARAPSDLVPSSEPQPPRPNSLVARRIHLFQSLLVVRESVLRRHLDCPRFDLHLLFDHLNRHRLRLFLHRRLISISLHYFVFTSGLNSTSRS